MGPKLDSKHGICVNQEPSADVSQIYRLPSVEVGIVEPLTLSRSLFIFCNSTSVGGCASVRPGRAKVEHVLIPTWLSGPGFVLGSGVYLVLRAHFRPTRVQTLVDAAENLALAPMDTVSRHGSRNPILFT